MNRAAVSAVRQRAALAVALTEQIERVEMTLAEAHAARTLFLSFGVEPGSYTVIHEFRSGIIPQAYRDTPFPKMLVTGGDGVPNSSTVVYEDGAVEMNFTLDATALGKDFTVAEMIGGAAVEHAREDCFSDPLAALLDIGYFHAPEERPQTEHEKKEAESVQGLLSRALIETFGFSAESVTDAVYVEVDRGDGSTRALYKAMYDAPGGGSFLLAMEDGEEPVPLVYATPGADFERVETAADVAAMDAKGKGARS